MFYHRERCLTTICKENGERARGTEASKEVSDQVLKKGRDFFSDNVMVNDTRYFGYYMPIKDSKNNISGMMFAGKPRKDILIEMSKSIAIIFCAAFITIIIAANIVFHYGKRVIGSLNQIKKFLKDIAEGDLTTKIDSKILDRQDEIGQMGRFSVMLKDSITDLVGKDPLTRLHNRRSCQVVLDSFENKYKKDGNEIEESFFYNVRMSKEKYESNKEMFEIGKAVVVRGSIRNYMDKYNNKISFINCNSVKEYVDEPKK